MNIRICRELAGLTSSELARRVGVTPTAVSRWESGLDVPSAARLPKLAKTMGCSIDQLFGLAPPPAPAGERIVRPTT